MYIVWESGRKGLHDVIHKCDCAAMISDMAIYSSVPGSAVSSASLQGHL